MNFDEDQQLLLTYALAVLIRRAGGEVSISQVEMNDRQGQVLFSKEDSERNGWVFRLVEKS